MSETAPQTSESTAQERRVFATLLDLAAAPRSRQEFFRKALAAVGQCFSSPCAALHVRLATETIDEEFHSGPTDPRFWRQTVQDVLTETLADGRARARLLCARNSDLRMALVSSSIYDARAGRPGAIALVTRCDEASLREKLVALESIATLVSHLAGSVSTAASQAAAGPAANVTVARAASFETVEQLAFSIANGLRTRLALEQVVVGVVRRRRCKVISISGLDDVNLRSPGVKQIAAAMEECLDADKSLVQQADDSWGADRLSGGHRLHRQWADAVGGACVASIPLRDASGVVAVVSVRRRRDDLLTRDLLTKLLSTLEPLAPAFNLVEKARRSLPQHVVQSAADQWRALVGPGRVLRKAGVVGLLGLVAWIAFGAADYLVSVPCRVIASESRVMAAPFDGFLAATSAKPGDSVRAGELVLQVDDRDLQLQRAHHVSQIAALEQQRLQALAVGKVADSQIAEAGRNLEQARLALVERRLAMCRIDAPFDGVVASGELRHRVGGPISRGEPLLTIAPRTGWKVEIELPQRSVAQVEIGASAKFSSNARPDLTQDICVSAVMPQPQIRDRRSVYVAEAYVDNAADWIKPGMEGVARVDCGRKPVAWVLFHRAVDYLRLNGWL
ncbi:MAG: HlyD family efflux transporter periplasmic adaptor subunit [Planctomycetes bacterium]|nr:HlyD family efflux transporter periplasmic adaptor subunit [Planctomycetota bacterium]